MFLNVSELASQSQRFSQRLREAVEIALEQGDEDLLTVDVARLFLDKETEEMMDAFRRYCVRSVSVTRSQLHLSVTSRFFSPRLFHNETKGEASLLLSSLEKERELLRIFLRASQLENPALRRMDLHAFLMVNSHLNCLLRRACVIDDRRCFLCRFPATGSSAAHHQVPAAFGAPLARHCPARR